MRDRLPRPVCVLPDGRLSEDGQGLSGHFVPSPFRFCLGCGVAYNARWLNEAVERFAGRRLEPVRIFGGGAVSSLWCQIHADVMDRRIERVAQPLHANLRGAALLAALALGAVDRYEVRALVPVDRVFEPGPSAGEAYGRLYAEFPGLYKAQRKMFARLNR